MDDDRVTGRVRRPSGYYFTSATPKHKNAHRKHDVKPKDPRKEWEKVKDAWCGDQAAWERYSGMKIPE